MTKRSFSLADFTPSQADLFRGYRYGMIGVWDPAYPRWMPNYKDAYLVHATAGDQMPGRYFDADRNEHWLPPAIFDKMWRFGLLEETEARTEAFFGKALTYSGWGLDFLITGHTDLNKSPPVEVLDYLQMIRDRADEEFHGGNSPPFILRERNSTLLVDEIDTAFGADRIGMLVTPEATLAVAYDRRGLRITDVLVEHGLNDPASWLERFVYDPASRHPVTVDDLGPGIRLADLFGVPRERIHQDEALLDDIMQRRTCIFNPRRGVIPQVRADVLVHRPPGPAH
jgi:hypothetical protein